MLAQISAYMANVNNEQRRSETGSCELSRLASSEATERLGLQKARVTRREDMEISQSCFARTVKFIWALEEHRDNDRTKFWSVSCSRKKAERRKGGTMVQINGEQQDVALVAGKTLLAYVTEAGYDPVGIVIEKNMEIIHREDFDKVNIDDGDVIEILHFVGGGQF